MAIDGGGNKWIGTYFGGLAKLDGATWTVYNTANSGLPSNDVSSIAIDGGGKKWIGTYFGGLAKFDGATWTVYSLANSGLPDSSVLSIAIDGSGNKWIGTYAGGLTKFDDIQWTDYNPYYFGLMSQEVHSITIDGNGNKWIGTYGGGLAKLEDTTWTVYNTLNSGLPDDYVLSITIDGNGKKWIGTYAGLAIFSGDNSVIKLIHMKAQNPLTLSCLNYPNPFKQKTLINYNVLENGPVSLKIYMLDGHLVQTLVNAKQTIGQYSVSWDGKNDKGKIMAHGVYLYQLRSNSGIISKRMSFVE
jgi:ligand-binding sensor domain-containing protein